MNRRKFSAMIAAAVATLFVPLISNATERFCTVVTDPKVSFKVDRDYWFGWQERRP